MCLCVFFRVIIRVIIPGKLSHLSSPLWLYSFCAFVSNLRQKIVNIQQPQAMNGVLVEGGPRDDYVDFAHVHNTGYKSASSLRFATIKSG